MTGRNSSLRQMRDGVRDRRARRRSRESLTEPLARAVLRNQAKAFLICLIVVAFGVVGIKIGANYTKQNVPVPAVTAPTATPTPTPLPELDDPPAGDGFDRDGRSLR